MITIEDACTIYAKAHADEGPCSNVYDCDGFYLFYPDAHIGGGGFGFFGYTVDKETGEMKDRDFAEYNDYRGQTDVVPWPENVKM